MCVIIYLENLQSKICWNWWLCFRKGFCHKNLTAQCLWGNFSGVWCAVCQLWAPGTVETPEVVAHIPGCNPGICNTKLKATAIITTIVIFWKLFKVMECIHRIPFQSWLIANTKIFSHLDLCQVCLKSLFPFVKNITVLDQNQHLSYCESCCAR